MGMARINWLRNLHNRVIHQNEQVVRNENGEIIEELDVKETKEIAKEKNNTVLQMVCPKCFPILEDRPKYPSREYWQYDKFYPKITEIIWEQQK